MKLSWERGSKSLQVPHPSIRIYNLFEGSTKKFMQIIVKGYIENKRNNQRRISSTLNLKDSVLENIIVFITSNDARIVLISSDQV